VSARPQSAAPTVVVCAGGGGVGKTTTSAALALALAREGATTLVVTVDPARRLADAMGVAVGPVTLPATIEPGVEGKLFALMPEPRVSTRAFIDWLFEQDPEAHARMIANPVYQVLADALSGVHELVSTMLIVRAVDERAYEYVVVDTAPSRYALDFLSYPGKLASLLEGKAVSWLGSLAQRAQGGEPEETGGAFSWGRKRVEGALGRVLGARFLVNMTALFADLSRVRERFATLARRSEALLLGDASRYVLVAAPTGAAHADVKFLFNRLSKIERHATAVVLNRADATAPAWVGILEAEKDVPRELREAIAQLETEREARTLAADQMAREIARTYHRLPLVRLPRLDAPKPSDVVRSLATHLAPHLAELSGRPTPR